MSCMIGLKAGINRLSLDWVRVRMAFLVKDGEGVNDILAGNNAVCVVGVVGSQPSVGRQGDNRSPFRNLVLPITARSG